MNNTSLIKQSIIEPELYFLISKFLSDGPLKETSKILIKELEQHQVLPKRVDWLGEEHEQTFEELERKYSHIGPQHLLELCCRVTPILDRELPPSVAGVLSLLGAGRQSLLRTKESISRPKGIVEYCTRLHGKPLADSIQRTNSHNLVRVLFGRECSGPITRRLVIPPTFYEKLQLLRRTLGHLSAVYCVLFDRTGKYIITGADDLLVKLWSAIDGRLLATFRGASAEITDIAINLDNTLLAAGSIDRLIRVWDLQTTGPVAVLNSHTGMITSVNFCPSPRGDLRYLVSTSTDGSVAFWQYTTQRGGKTGFASKPIQYHEKLRPGQAQMICASFSPGGLFLAAGSADHYVRVYIMSEDGPKRILETESHSDTVDSIQWAHTGLKFVSGSKDGTAQVWHFESQQWKSFKLNMSDRLSTCPPPDDESKKLKVTMVSWDYSDKWIITAANDFTIKVWNSVSGELVRVLRGHADELYVLESHPKDSNVLLSAGHDGQIMIWDILEGISIACFANHIEGQGHGGVFDAKWSQDGTMIAATDSHGHILVFGFGVGHEKLKMLPKELFFHTDYRPLIRDANHYVLDEQTQTMPHLMPPPFLVDVDGNPHPPSLQRLVPGRENCPSDQLIPNIGLGAEGVEIIQEEGVRSDLDRLIEALANRQGQEQAPDSNNDRENNIQNRLINNNSPRSHRIALRRTGDVEGVRQSSGNWQKEGNFKFVRRIFVKPIKYSQLQTMKQTVFAAGLHEMELYRREMRRRPLMINTLSNSLSGALGARRRGRLPKKGVPPAYRTRAVQREHVEEHEHTESLSVSSESESTSNEALLMSGSSSSETESSDYSDWIADEPGINLEPPKRSKRKHVQKRIYSPESDANDTNNRQPRGKKINMPNGEIPEFYRPPEWLSEVIPRKAPYYPQMGDEVVYLRQGHQQYLEAVRNKKVYKLNINSEPWTYIELGEHEFCKVIGIKYEIRPPRLCCLKLGLINRNGYLTGNSFTIKYHDMPDVLDFLVLRQTFDTAVNRNWAPGDRFRCMIDDGWWMGLIEARTALSTQFLNSLFMCFRVRWDNGEYEYMSPWDMEPVDENRLPAEVGGAVPVLPEELRATLYQPKAEEWPRGDREATCRRIMSGFEQVMGLAIADPFLAPVDLNIYPGYAFVVEYPIDISTIKARFENHFYRRITSAQFDVRYLATNAEKFNESHSNIVKHARIITDLCLRIIRDQNDLDVGAVYHQLVDTYISSESENENQAGPSGINDRRKTGSRRSKRLQSSGDWRADCRQLLEMMWQCDDSTPFREPVDIIEHPDYHQVIDTPMDLLTVKEDLLGGNYNTPTAFAKDVRLIFQNSRNYNTNKRSRIYSMTLRLSTLFEAYIKSIFANWKTQRRRKGNKKLHRSTRTTNGTGGTGGRNSDSSDDDDNEDKQNKRSFGRPRRTGANNASGSNTVSSSVNNEPMPGPSNIRRGRGRPRLTNSQENHRSDLSTSSTSSSTSDDSDDSGAIPLAALGDGQKQRQLAARKNRNCDSEDSYKPNKRNKDGTKRPVGRPRKNRSQHSLPTTPKKYNRKRHNDDDDDNAASSDEDKRPKKKRRSNHNDSNSNHLFKIKREISSHSENRSNSSQSSEDGCENNGSGSKRRGKRNRRYESDQSYHLDVPPTRRPVIESDSTNENSTRPTRGSTRRAKLNWGRDTDSLEEANDENKIRNHPPMRRRRGKRKSETARKPEDDNRSARENRRNRVQKSDDDDNDGDSANENRLNGNSRTRSNRHHKIQTALVNGSPMNYSRRNHDSPAIASSSSIITNRYPIRFASTTSRVPTSVVEHALSVTSHSSNVMPHQDHNYGEPGPSSLRQSRRMLSRHQRNADELDNIEMEDPLSIPQPSTSSSLSSRLRLRNTVNNNNNSNSNSSKNSNSNRIPKTNFSSTLRTNYFDDESDDDDDEDDNVVLGAKYKKGQSKNSIINQESSDDEDNDNEMQVHDDDDDNDTDPEDNKPLQMMVSSTKKSRLHNTRSGGVTKRHYYSDEAQDAGPSTVPASSGLRATRNLKRLQYNEESDESGNNIHRAQFRKRLLSPNNNSSSNSPNRSSNSQTSTTNPNNGNSQQTEDASDTEQLVSISSRGRVRKITAKARGLFKE